ncbi:hypothetical protein TM49_11975 [Martelella endophytica]|uniref:Uncharacterized protein n=1 Tax=Martelella endophytica TaxID=1486262 RepID=A0A0D5LS86_MAREN|nr:hypothetical protein TM49_11975 [Martelella endophytica]
MTGGIHQLRDYPLIAKGFTRAYVLVPGGRQVFQCHITTKAAEQACAERQQAPSAVQSRVILRSVGRILK